MSCRAQHPSRKGRKAAAGALQSKRERTGLKSAQMQSRPAKGCEGKANSRETLAEQAEAIRVGVYGNRREKKGRPLSPRPCWVAGLLNSLLSPISSIFLFLRAITMIFPL